MVILGCLLVANVLSGIMQKAMTKGKVERMPATFPGNLVYMALPAVGQAIRGAFKLQGISIPYLQQDTRLFKEWAAVFYLAFFAYLSKCEL
jgi:hypothetical protein